MAGAALPWRRRHRSARARGRWVVALAAAMLAHARTAAPDAPPAQPQAQQAACRSRLTPSQCGRILPAGVVLRLAGGAGHGCGGGICGGGARAEGGAACDRDDEVRCLPTEPAARRHGSAASPLRLAGGWWGSGAASGAGEGAEVMGGGGGTEAGVYRTLATTGHTHMSYYGFMCDLRATSLCPAPPRPSSALCCAAIPAQHA